MPDGLQALLPALPLLWQCICHSVLQANYLLLNLHTWYNRVKALTGQVRTTFNTQENQAHHTLPQGGNKSSWSPSSCAQDPELCDSLVLGSS